jgi:hypothetical protein
MSMSFSGTPEIPITIVGGSEPWRIKHLNEGEAFESGTFCLTDDEGLQEAAH